MGECLALCLVGRCDGEVKHCYATLHYTPTDRSRDLRLALIDASISLMPYRHQCSIPGTRYVFCKSSLHYKLKLLIIIFRKIEDSIRVAEQRRKTCPFPSSSEVILRAHNGNIKIDVYRRRLSISKSVFNNIQRARI